MDGKIETILYWAPDGHCYLKLLIALPRFETCTYDEFHFAAWELHQHLGQNPTGADMLIGLTWANDLMKPGAQDLNRETLGQHAVDVLSKKEPEHGVLQYVMKSKTRFGFEDHGGVYHVSTFVTRPCLHDELECNHGWDISYVTSMLSSQTTRIGADVIMLDELFSDAGLTPDDTCTASSFESIEPEDNPTMIHELRHQITKKHPIELENEIDQKNEVIQDQLDEIRRLSSRMNAPGKDIADMPEGNYKRDMEILSRQVQSITSKLGQILSSDSANSSVVTPKVRMREPSHKLPSLSPSDSSSHIDRYNRKFLSPGTVYSVLRNGKVVEEEQVEIQRPTIIKPVVRGFMKTEQMLEIETKINDTVRPINGLAAPFKNHRLNLLVHFHTALETVRSEDMQIDDFQVLQTLYSYRARTPSEELAQQMVTKTFNVETRVVVANPFRLPYIEIGMQISDNSLAKCFYLLNSEYQSLWFDEMKNLIPPSFSSEFRGFTETQLSVERKRRHTTRHATGREGDTRSHGVSHSDKGRSERSTSSRAPSTVSTRSTVSNARRGQSLLSMLRN